MISIVLLYFIQLCGCSVMGVSYIVNMDSQMECCDEESEGFADVSGVSVTRYNESVTYMTGTIKFLQDVGHDTLVSLAYGGQHIKVEVMLKKESSGKYELLYVHEINDLCDEVTKGEESDYNPYLKCLGIPDKCPFAAGEYPIKEFVLDTDELPLNSNTMGRYQALMNLYKKTEKNGTPTREFMCCFSIKVIVEMD